VTLVIKPGYPIESKPKKIMKQNSQTSKIKKKIAIKRIKTKLENKINQE
jgi:hypothetical protein